MSNPALIKAMEFQFTAPDDIEKYGADWYTYDELTILTLPARRLIELETEMRIPLPAILNGMRESSVLGDTGAAWIALKLAGREVPWDGFDPSILLAQWRVKADDPKEVDPSSLRVPGTDPMDIAVLETSPPAESPSS